MKQVGLMKGITAPLLTPFQRDGQVDYAGYTRLASYVTRSGAHGVFVGGTTGEFVNLTLRERMGLLEAAQRGLEKEARVMCNITAMNLEDLRLLANHARESGVDAVSVTAPYYHRYDARALNPIAKGNGIFVVLAYFASSSLSAFWNFPVTCHVLCDTMKSRGDDSCRKADCFGLSIIFWIKENRLHLNLQKNSRCL